jgi:uncharacterized membrane protein YdjX (TVP38/TMEM64 family)
MGVQKIEAVKKYSWYKLIFGGLFLVLFVLFCIKEGRSILYIVNNPDRLKEWLELYGTFSMVAYIIVQTLVMVLTPVPSEALLFTGGYLYGTVAGTICSMLVICSGTMAAFGLARHFGLPFIKTLVPVKYWEKFQCIQQNPFIEGILFMLFLIPGLPKDALTYIVGFTTTRISKSFLFILIARTPSIIISSYIGANLREQTYQPLLTGASIIIILLILGLRFKNKILAKTKTWFQINAS